MSQIAEMELMIKERFKYYEEGNSLFEKTYDYLIKELSESRYIDERHYTFLCWLNYNGEVKFPSQVNRPHIPELIEISEMEFAERFCINAGRNELFKLLKDFLRKRKEEFGVNFIDVLFGGSFVDENCETPNDIDCTILLDKIIMNNFIVIDYEKYCPKSKVDVQYVNDDCSFADYWFYAQLTYLGNIPEIREKNNLLWLKNNTFKKRDIFKVRFLYSIQDSNAEQ